MSDKLKILIDDIEKFTLDMTANGNRSRWSEMVLPFLCELRDKRTANTALLDQVGQYVQLRLEYDNVIQDILTYGFEKWTIERINKLQATQLPLPPRLEKLEEVARAAVMVDEIYQDKELFNSPTEYSRLGKALLAMRDALRRLEEEKQC